MFNFVFFFSAVIVAVNCRNESDLSWASAEEYQCIHGGILTVDTRTGILMSPNYPDVYPNSFECAWKITTNTSVVLVFDAFELEGRNYWGYCKDFVEIYDGDERVNDRLIGQFCGLEIPGLIFSTGTTLCVRFKSDFWTRKRGFKAHWFSKSLDGGWSEWSQWSNCDKTCGEGVNTRTRECNSPTPLNGGEECLEGSNLEKRACNEAPCPIDGRWSEWSQWSNCDKTCGEGANTRTRDCNNPSPQNGGIECLEGSDFEMRTCNEDPCPVDGSWSEWTQWSNCDKTCGEGVNRRNRQCDNPTPQNGGKECSGGSDLDMRPCNDVPCPVDGDWSEWSQWSDCDKTCGEGVNTRTRECNSPSPQNGGKECLEGLNLENRICNEDPCPVDGNWSDWSEWSNCDETCGVGANRRTRKCDNPSPQNGGKECSEGSDLDRRTCNEVPCPIDGDWSEWSQWSDCDKTCGDGVNTRTRECNNPSPQNGGTECLGLDLENEPCNTDPCPVDGNWSEWSQWSDCDKTCGDGVNTRTRECNNPSPQNGGKGCLEGSELDMRICNKGPCPIDGNWSEWSQWSNCSRTCGGGHNTRTRKCNNPSPRNGGKECAEGLDLEMRKCNEDPCTIDEGWSEWSQWSNCSATCGEGDNTRTRVCNNPSPQNGGRECTEDTKQETKVCHEDPCPVYKCVEDNTLPIHKNYGVLISPNYPDDYPNRFDCAWKIKSRTRVTLTFDTFELEGRNWFNYCNDVVEIYDGPEIDDSDLIGVFCGNEIPEPITSSGNTLWVRFESNFWGTRSGFKAHWKPSVN